jgi:hypothetical protein
LANPVFSKFCFQVEMKLYVLCLNELLISLCAEKKRKIGIVHESCKQGCNIKG